MWQPRKLWAFTSPRNLGLEPSVLLVGKFEFEPHGSAPIFEGVLERLAAATVRAAAKRTIAMVRN